MDPLIKSQQVERGRHAPCVGPSPVLRACLARGSGVRASLAAPSVPHYRARGRERFWTDQFGEPALNLDLETLPRRVGVDDDPVNERAERLHEPPVRFALALRVSPFRQGRSEGFDLPEISVD